MKSRHHPTQNLAAMLNYHLYTEDRVSEWLDSPK